MHAGQPVRRISVFGVIVLGLTAVAMTLIVSGSAMVLYGMRIIDRKADNVTDAVRMVVEELPAVRAALPPVLSDALRDERRPDYAPRLRIEAGLKRHSTYAGRSEPVISVENTGDEVVSTLAVRLVALDESRRPTREWTEYVATPLAIEDKWRGPLMPGATRRAVLGRTCPKDTSALEYEVTELRVWDRAAAEASE